MIYRVQLYSFRKLRSIHVFLSRFVVADFLMQGLNNSSLAARHLKVPFSFCLEINELEGNLMESVLLGRTLAVRVMFSKQNYSFLGLYLTFPYIGCYRFQR